MEEILQKIVLVEEKLNSVEKEIDEFNIILRKDFTEWENVEKNQYGDHQQLRKEKGRLRTEKEQLRTEKEQLRKEKDLLLNQQHLKEFVFKIPQKRNDRLEDNAVIKRSRVNPFYEEISDALPMEFNGSFLEKPGEEISTNERINFGLFPKPIQHLTDVDFILQTALSAKFDSLPTVNELQDCLKKKILRRIPILCDHNKFCVLAPQQDELVYQNEVSEQSKLGDIVYSIIHHEVSLDSSEIMLIYTIDHLVRAVLAFFKILSISLDRNVHDSSLSASRVRPDFLCWLNSVLVFRGEEKGRRADFNEAKNELIGKLNSWPLLYVGSLPYLLSYACAGEHFQFFAITPKLHFLSISPVYMLTLPQHRFAIIRSMINIVRLFTTMLPYLPQQNPLPLYGTRKFSSCHIQFFEDYVIKTCEISVVSLYPKHLRRLYDDTAHVPHLIHCYSLSTMGSGMELKLSPIGINRMPCSETELRNAVKCVLLALQGLHKAGYVHRNIRWPNILTTAQNTWVLIDLESAGRIGDPLPKPIEEAPEREWVEKSDVYLVGKLLKTQMIVKLSPLAKEFLRVSYELNLENRCSVEEALEHSWIKNEVNEEVVE